MRQTGIVLLFKNDRGFGFIKSEKGSSLFYHVSDVQDRLILEPGDKVTFEAGPSVRKPDQIACTNVVLVERAAVTAAPVELAPKAVQS